MFLILIYGARANNQQSHSLVKFLVCSSVCVYVCVCVLIPSMANLLDRRGNVIFQQLIEICYLLWSLCAFRG